MVETEFTFSGNHKSLPRGYTTWKAPSNIALIKYWGKHGYQLPKNPSLSFTLSNCTTKTSLHYETKKEQSSVINFEVSFEGKPTEDFNPKIQTFFKRIEKYVPFIKDYNFQINTENTFPHSSGIASSASGMAALALCIMDMEKQLNPRISEAYFYKKASHLARLGSGSAARSLHGPITVWGNHPSVKNSCDKYAVMPSFKLNSVFHSYQDTVLIVHEGQKEVSSSLGHNLMVGHPFAESHFDQAFVNLELLIDVLEKGQQAEFVEIVEKEALALHAMMMTSSPYFILMKPATLSIIQNVWKYRKANKSHLCFTLDAGANVHLLYPENEKEKVLSFIDKELVQFCENGKYIKDCIGKGPEKIS